MNDQQSEVLNFIRQFIQAHGYSPTYAEIIAGTSLTNKPQVASCFAVLEALGKITREGSKPRTVRPVPNHQQETPA